LNSPKYPEAIKFNKNAKNAPPTNPSTVFLGESLIRGVLPNLDPH